jgi:hypothetical protein
VPRYFLKDPDAKRLVTWDWSRWLTTAQGDAISSVDELSIVPSGGLEIEGTPTFDDTTVSAWLIGGDAGTTYNITCRIVTDAAVTPPETDDRTMTVVVQER